MSDTEKSGPDDAAPADGTQWETLNETVWVSLTFGRTTRTREADSDLSLADLESAADVIRRNRAGELLPRERFPKEFYGKYSDKKLKKLPDLFKLGGFWGVSARCAGVLRQFDLGRTTFYPIKVYEFDRTTPVEGEFFCMAFGENKETFLPGESPGVSGNRYQDPVREWRARGDCKDGGVAVHEAALQGVDLWIDPQLFEGVFMSDALVKALRVAKVGRLFEYRKCRVLRPSKSTGS